MRPRFQLAAGAALLAAAANAASALDIQIVYDTSIPDAVDCCFDGEACCDRIDELLWHVGIAAAMWGDIIKDDTTLTLRYCFADVSAPDGTATDHDGSGRPTEGRIRIPYDWGLYWDSTPNSHEEFDMTPRFYRDTHPVEQGEAFLGNPPEILEVGYNGFGPGNDALTIILHEIGHVLGLNGATNPCAGGATFYFPPADLSAGGGWAIKSFPTDCNHLDVGGIQACDDEPVCEAHQALMWTGMLPGARALPSVTDIAAIALTGNWQEIDLPRKFALQSGDWDDDMTWFGERAPDSSDDVYLSTANSNVTVESYGMEDIKNVYVTQSNNLNVVTGVLDINNDLDVRDNGDVTIDIGAELEASHVHIEPDASIHVRSAGLLDAFSIVNEGDLYGGGTVDATSLSNSGTIRASGGDLLIQVANDADLDGTGTNAALVANIGDVTIDADVPEPVLADVSVGPDRTMTFVHGWTQQNPGILDHAITLDGDGGWATIAGDSNLYGPVDVFGTVRFNDNVLYGPSAQVGLADGSLLRHNGIATYSGGVLAGNGTIYEAGGVVVDWPTIVGPLDIYDMDGTGTTHVSVQAGASFTVLANALETSALDGFDGNLNIDGTCVITTDDPWRLQGVILMNLAGGTHARLAGSQVEVEGTMSGRHLMEIDSPVRVHTGANIHTIDTATQLVLDSTDPNELAGGAITGDGTAFVAPHASLFGIGTVEPTLQIDGETRAGDGWLVLEQAPIVNGTLGTTNDLSVLFVSESWANNGGLVNNRNGWFGGESFTNRADTTGHGFMAMTQFTNKGRLAPGAPDAIGDGSAGAGLLAFFDFAQTAAGRTELMIGGLAVGDSDGIIVDGPATLDGELALSLDDGYLPEIGDVIAIMTYTSRAGSFSNVTGTTLPGARSFVVGYEADHAYVEVVAGCAGDVDGDGMTGFSDVIEVLADWGSCPDDAPCPSDLDGSGDVGFADLLEVLAHWGGC